MIDKLKGYRTLIFGFLVTVLGLLSSLADDPTFKKFVADHFPAAIGWIGVAILVLRAITTGPVPALTDEVESGDTTPEAMK